jgi:hypothetical protein
MRDAPAFEALLKASNPRRWLGRLGGIAENWGHRSWLLGVMDQARASVLGVLPAILGPPCGRASVETYILGLAGLGVLILLTAWLPMILKEAPLSLPIACVITGAGIFGLLPVPGPPSDLIGNRSVTERLTELVVIISLMGAGLKIDRPFALRS